MPDTFPSGTPPGVPVTPAIPADLARLLTEHAKAHAYVAEVDVPGGDGEAWSNADIMRERAEDAIAEWTRANLLAKEPTP